MKHYLVTLRPFCVQAESEEDALDKIAEFIRPMANDEHGVPFPMVDKVSYLHTHPTNGET
jgi:hypothetical protein